MKSIIKEKDKDINYMQKEMSEFKSVNTLLEQQIKE
jgi:hypothetical protein